MTPVDIPPEAVPSAAARRLLSAAALLPSSADRVLLAMVYVACNEQRIENACEAAGVEGGDFGMRLLASVVKHCDAGHNLAMASLIEQHAKTKGGFERGPFSAQRVGNVCGVFVEATSIAVDLVAPALKVDCSEESRAE